MHIHSVRLVIGTCRLTWTNFATISVATATATGAAALLEVIRRVGLVSTLLDTFGQPAHPPCLVLVRGRQQEHLARMIGIVMQLTRRQRVVIVHVLFMQLKAASFAFVGR